MVTTLQLKPKKIPHFVGTVEIKLRNTCRWISKNEPGRCLTLEEIASVMGVTRERVRQLEAQALRKLRHPNRLRFLNELHSTKLIN